VIEDRQDPIGAPGVGRCLPDPLKIETVEEPHQDLQKEQDEEVEESLHCSGLEFLIDPTGGLSGASTAVR